MQISRKKIYYLKFSRVKLDGVLGVITTINCFNTCYINGYNRDFVNSFTE